MPRSEEIKSCYVCTYTSCAKWGGEALFEGLKERLAETGVRVKEYVCFGMCPMGPNIMLHPRGTWYADVKPEDMDDIAAHIKGGEPVGRLIRDIDQDTLNMALWMVDLDPE